MGRGWEYTGEETRAVNAKDTGGPIYAFYPDFPHVMHPVKDAGTFRPPRSHSPDYMSGREQKGDNLSANPIRDGVSGMVEIPDDVMAQMGAGPAIGNLPG